MAEQDSEQTRRDADLEAAVLDTLTDSVLTGAAAAPLAVRISHTPSLEYSLSPAGQECSEWQMISKSSTGPNMVAKRGLMLSVGLGMLLCEQRGGLKAVSCLQRVRVRPRMSWSSLWR